MTTRALDHPAEVPLVELFRIEAAEQIASLTSGLLQLEQDSTAAASLEASMRAAHSLKGAARIVDLPGVVQVAHALEDCLVAAQKNAIVLRKDDIDTLLRGVDLLKAMTEQAAAGPGDPNPEREPAIAAMLATLAGVLVPKADTPRVQAAVAPEREVAPSTQAASAPTAGMIRVTAASLNRLLGLAGESLVESRRLRHFSESLQQLKRLQAGLGRSLEGLQLSLDERRGDELARRELRGIQERMTAARQFLATRLDELEMFDRRSVNLSHRLYTEALACRMRPFADGIQGFPRMVRDVSRALDKDVRLVIQGEDTQVDRDILEKLEAPLSHLLRNAVDHGIEAPGDREMSGKPRCGTIRLEAYHSGGMLQIVVSDDGRGMEPEVLRQSVVSRGAVTAETASRLSEAELFEFLFLPGFSMKTDVTEFSGRGVGLDVVQHMVRNLRGAVRVSAHPGAGMRFQLELPLTLSVVRTLLAEVTGEPYAFPLARISRTLKLPRRSVATLEGRQHFNLDGREIGLVTAHQVLNCGAPPADDEALSIIVLEDHGHAYGVVVDRFLGGRELVVQALDPRLGEVRNVAAGALMEDGAPVLIIDIDDLIRSIEIVSSEGSLRHVVNPGPDRDAPDQPRKQKHVLVIDDSLTVRELERKLLLARGYEVTVAVDGMDGWYRVRNEPFDLVITDVDMPRMDGIELVRLIRSNARTRSLPIMIVSYKDREEDRLRGLDAGADHYLTKGSFHGDSLYQSVRDLIGEAVLAGESTLS